MESVQPSDWRRLLSVAEGEREIDTLGDLLKPPEPLDLLTDERLTLPMVCVKKKNFTLFQRLLSSQKFNISRLDDEGFSVLDHAVSLGSDGFNFVRALISHCKESLIEFKSLGNHHYQYPTMKRAILSGDITIVEMLVDNGYEICFKLDDYNWVMAAFDSTKIDPFTKRPVMVDYLVRKQKISTPSELAYFLLDANLEKHMEAMKSLSLDLLGVGLITLVFLYSNISMVFNFLEIDHTLIEGLNEDGANLLMMVADFGCVPAFPLLLSDYPYLYQHKDKHGKTVVDYIQESEFGDGDIILKIYLDHKLKYPPPDFYNPFMRKCDLPLKSTEDVISMGSAECLPSELTLAQCFPHSPESSDDVIYMRSAECFPSELTLAKCFQQSLESPDLLDLIKKEKISIMTSIDIPLAEYFPPSRSLAPRPTLKVCAEKKKIHKQRRPYRGRKTNDN